MCIIKAFFISIYAINIATLQSLDEVNSTRFLTREPCEEWAELSEAHCWREEGRPKMPSLRTIVPPAYDMFEPPFIRDKKPFPVFLSIKARDVQKIDEQENEVTLELFLRIFWTDPRLQPPEYLTEKKWHNMDPAIIKYLWMPTAFIDHVREVKSPYFLIAPTSIRIQKSKFIRLSMSLTSRFSCPMDFRSYPFDTQVCYFTLESYQFSSEQISYRWLDKIVEVGKRIKLTQFDFRFELEHQKNSLHQNRSFPRVSIKLVLRRRASYHLMNTYLPSTLFVLVAFMTFLISNDQVPGRMVLTITTLLTLVSMFSSVKNESPKVSYTKAVDQWMISCTVFVFLVLVEFTLSLYFKDKAKKAKIKLEVERSMVTHPEPNEQKPLFYHTAKSVQKEVLSAMKIPKKVDSQQKDKCYYALMEFRLERWTGPFLIITFIGFNICYWIYWMIKFWNNNVFE